MSIVFERKINGIPTTFCLRIFSDINRLIITQTGGFGIWLIVSHENFDFNVEILIGDRENCDYEFLVARMCSNEFIQRKIQQQQHEEINENDSDSLSLNKPILCCLAFKKNEKYELPSKSTMKELLEVVNEMIFKILK
jgi:hypothetical protein